MALVTTDVSGEHITSIIKRWLQCIPPKHQVFQEPHGVTSQKTAFFKIIIALPLMKHEIKI
jgi:hypothetical protein